VEEQIQLYFRRCQNLRRASCLLIYAEYFFLATILFACLSIVFPQLALIKAAGAAAMFAGLLAIAVGAAIEMQENRLSKVAIESEMHDLDGLKDRPDWLEDKAA
jgi:hypothetical protein